MAKIRVKPPVKPAGGSTGDTRQQKEIPMPDENVKVAELEGQVSDMEATIDKLTKQLEALSKDTPDLRKSAELEADLGEALLKMDELTEALQKVSEEKAALEKAAKLAKAEASLTDEEREYYKKFPWQKDKEDKEKEEYLSLDPEERKKRAKMAKAADETVELDGETIRKSEVGEGTFKVLKKQAERIAKTEEDLKKQREDTELARLEKRASDEFGHIPGEAPVKAKMLKAIDAIADEDIRKAVTSVFVSHEKLLKSGFDKIGGRPAQEDESIQKQAKDFEAKVEKIQRDDKCTNTEALAKARKAHPDLFKAYQGNQN